jgi:hypothetical protein
MDYGEVDLPGYLHGDEILGYQEHAVDRQRGAHPVIHSPIRYAFYKYVENQQTYVLLLEGGPECITKGDDDRYYLCNDFGDAITQNLTPIPVPVQSDFQNRVGLLGVFALCANENTCSKPVDIMTWYGKYAHAEPDAELLKAVQGVSVNGQKIVYFPFTKDDLPPKHRFKPSEEGPSGGHRHRQQQQQQEQEQTEPDQ